jgi:hypothetical protein
MTAKDTLIEIRIQRRVDGETFAAQVGEFEFVAVPRMGEFVHVTDKAGNNTTGRVCGVDHFAEALPPFVSGAFILVTLETEE